MRFLTASLAFLGLLIPQAQIPFGVETYLIPAKMEPRWITIEYENPNCPPLNKNAFGREVVIPESGFLCTSSSRHADWHRVRYLLVGPGNRRNPLGANERIHRRGSFNLRDSSSEPGKILCDVSGEEFFYGPINKLTNENPIRENKRFLRLHPECRLRSH